MARVFIHPRCFEGPALGALCATLEAHGFDMDHVRVGPADNRGRRDLVREVVADIGQTLYERMDRTRFYYRLNFIVEFEDNGELSPHEGVIL